jgi:hypothetical protein
MANEFFHINTVERTLECSIHNFFLAAATPTLAQPANIGRMLPSFKLIYSLFFLYAVSASRVLEWRIFRKGDIKKTVPRDFWLHVFS